MAKPTRFKSVRSLTNPSRRPEFAYKRKGSRSKKGKEEKE
jgi:hypothetical protein